MKKRISLLVSMLIIGTLFVQVSYAQLSGTKTIPGDYASISAAITALNSQGVGTGGVTFNIAAGYTETASNLVITATGTNANPIVFQKSGTGANPLITAGVGTGALDGIILLSGSDYVTFDGIDVIENTANTTTTTQMEWGYALLKIDGTNGSRYNKIQNCVITLNKANTSSVGIYSANHTTASTTALTVTDTSGSNSNNKFYSNIISNVNSGIWIGGFNDGTSPYVYYDQNNEVGTTGGKQNKIYNFASTTTAYGVYGIYQNKIKIFNSNVNNSGGTAATSTLYGIFLSTGLNSNVDIYGDTVTTVHGGTTSQMACIYNSMGGSGTSNTVNISNNVVQNCSYTTATSGAVYYITNTVSCYNLTIENNKFLNNTYGGSSTATGLNYFIYAYGGTATNNNWNINNNIFSNFTRTQSTLGTGVVYFVYVTASGLNLNINNNLVSDVTIPSTSVNAAIYVSSSIMTTFNCNNNIVRNVTRPNTSTGAFYNIYQSNGGTNGTATITNNSISGITVSGSGAIYGIYSSASMDKNIYGDTLYNFNTGGGSVYSLYTSTGNTSRVYNNYVSKMITTSGTIYGGYITGGTNNYWYNNFISDLQATSATGAISIAGIYPSGGTNNYLFNNSIYINATSTSTGTFGTAGIYASTSPTLDLRNNIIVNLSTPGPTAGYTSAYFRNSTTLSTYANTSNNNLLYVGTPASNRLLFYDGASSIQTMTEYKAYMTPREDNAVTELPPFMNVSTAPYNLHLNPSTATQCESGGITVSSPIAITNDYDGNARYPNTGYPINPSFPPISPDIGADEIGGIPLDVTGPFILYTPLPNTPLTTSRTITVTISDPAGVPTSGSGLPVLYWKINSGSYNNVAGTSLGGNQFSFTLGSGVTTGDIVSYYVCAQDSKSPPNVSCSPFNGVSGYSYNPPAVSTPPTNPSTYSITSGLSGDYTVGLSEFNKITGKNITFEKTVRRVLREVNIEEPIVKIQTAKGTEKDNIETTSSVTPKGRKELREVEEIVWIPKENGKEYKGDLYVKKNENPNLDYPKGTSGVYASLTAAFADLNARSIIGPTRFLLNDASYTTETFPLTVNINNTIMPTSTNTITIKPNVGIVSSISGSSSAAPLIKIMNSYVTIDGSNSTSGTTRDLTISNTSTTTPQVIGIYSTGTTSLVNETVKNCTIINGIKTSSAIVVYGNGATAGYFSNITIQNNSIQKAYWGIYALATIAVGNGSINITGNNMDVADTAVEVRMGIYAQGCYGVNISNNYIGNMYDNYGLTKRAIWFATGTTNSSITNNVLYSIGYPGTSSYTTYGITISPATVDANIDVSGNTISNLFSSGTSSTYGIYVLGASSGITIQKNKINGILNSNTGGYGARGINITSTASPANINILNNFIWNIVCTGDAGAAFWGIGIAIDATVGTINAYYNSVNLYGSYPGYTTATNSVAFYVSTGVTLLNVRNNIFKNSFNNTISTLDTSFAIKCLSANTAFSDINYNDYYVSDSVGLLGFLGTPRTTLSAWQTATGKDANSVSGIPYFYADTNLHIDFTQATPVKDAGQYISTITTDIDGNTRYNPPDIGGCEGTTMPLPLAPTLLLPTNGATGVSIVPTLDWNDVLSATSYKVQVASDSLFTSIVLDSSGISTSQFVVPSSKLSNNTKYYWRANATNPVGTGAWSTVWNFITVVTAPVAPGLLIPTNGATNVSLTPSMDWDSTSNATSFRLQITTDSTFTAAPAYDTAGLTVSQINVPAGKLSQTTRYFWRVNATNAGGTSVWSTVNRFTTQSLGLPLNLTVYLEGFWNGTSQATDTVGIYLASATAPFALVDSQKVVLSESGTANPTFTKASSGNYYIVVKHRNHLETWSGAPQSFVSGTPLNYNFTTDSAKALGNNMKKSGSVWVLYGGDANGDGDISGLDIPIFVTQFGSTGYLSCDFNGDGDVNALDVIIISVNFGISKVVPSSELVTPEIRNQKKVKLQKEFFETYNKQVKKTTNNNNN